MMQNDENIKVYNISTTAIPIGQSTPSPTMPITGSQSFLGSPDSLITSTHPVSINSTLDEHAKQKITEATFTTSSDTITGNSEAENIAIARNASVSVLASSIDQNNPSTVSAFPMSSLRARIDQIQTRPADDQIGNGRKNSSVDTSTAPIKVQATSHPAAVSNFPSPSLTSEQNLITSLVTSAPVFQTFQPLQITIAEQNVNGKNFASSFTEPPLELAQGTGSAKNSNQGSGTYIPVLLLGESDQKIANANYTNPKNLTITPPLQTDKPAQNTVSEQLSNLERTAPDAIVTFVPVQVNQQNTTYIYEETTQPNSFNSSSNKR
jgi:hypothetical protein